MASHIRQLKQGEILFKEGDPPDSMYVVKKGRLVVFKPKGNSEIELAEVGAGAMIGEMAFFDRKPRSASIRAALDSEIIELPYNALQAQFDKFPEWLKSMVKTINDHLREANKRIKNLEQAQGSMNYKGGGGKAPSFTPHQANKLAAILMFVAHKWGTPVEGGGVDVKPGPLRKFTIQVFQEPTSKMQALMEGLQGLGFLKMEDLGEGKQRITLLKKEMLEGFVEWFNEYLFASEDKRVTVKNDEMKVIKALLHFGAKLQPDEKGFVKVSLVEIQNESMKDLGYLVGVNDVNGLIAKNLTSDKLSEKDGTYLKFEIAELARIYPFWQIVYGLGLDQGIE
ncbi:MAG: Crp/Fnr family transcriptional regulator [Oligoflexia bacterium]|nr:Crp/Fnr family transcriptional regulator [Oligoflexia bacterium]